MEIKPILLFGMPRSGTTWLGKTFDSHPDTLYRHEPDNPHTLDSVPLIAPVEGMGRYGRMINDFAEGLRDIRAVRVTGKLPLFAKNYYSPARFQIRKSLLMSGKLASRFLGLEMPVANLIDFKRPGKIHLVWKSIESLGRLGVIARALPDCRAVQVIRHPCGYVASIQRGESQGSLGGSEPASEDYGIFKMLMATKQARSRGLTIELMKSLQPVERLAWRWALFNEKAMEDIEGLEGCSYVRYEDICEDPITGYRRLFDFTGLSWNPQTEQFVVQSTGNEVSAYYSVFKDPRKAAHSWKSTLSVGDIDRVLRVVQETRPGALYEAN